MQGLRLCRFSITLCATKFIFMLLNFCACWHQCYHLKKISKQPWICIYSSSLMYLLFLYSCFNRMSWMTLHRFGTHTPSGHRTTLTSPAVGPTWCLHYLNSMGQETSFPQLKMVFSTVQKWMYLSPDLYELCNIFMAESNLTLATDSYQAVNLYMHLREAIRACV